MDFLDKNCIAALDRLGEEVLALRQSIDGSRFRIGGEIDATIHETRAAENDKRTRDNRNFWLQVFLTLGTWLAFVAAGIYAGLAAVQTVQTREAINQATRAANCSEQANKDANIRFHEDIRPYVWITAPTEQMGKTGEVFSWNVHYRNFGKSPAIRVRSHFYVAMAPHAMDKVKTVGKIPLGGKRGESIEPPGADDKTADWISSEPVKLTDDEIRHFYGIENGLIVYGRIDYLGTDGTEYWSLACFGRQANGAIDWCPHHNEIH